MNDRKYTYFVNRKFVKSFKKYNPKTKKRVIEKVDIFLKDPYSPTLKTHKLTGKWDGYWAFSIEHNLRIMFKFAGRSEAEFVNIGTHEIYK